ncbi:4,5-DOPA dioxygenase extradiol [uncultured Parvimonas sp.]|uniref:4,5-DOPA-extradiol-dioxygenase n=1 Tax=uncultured Parvimonas sp. TaxID=747372 RepID=UPI0028D8DDE6|nr:4,5-DOPA dioxygenase extradiol [uncultured Parvimonas sp.]
MNNKNVVFIGHGSPMNAIENNEFSESWKFLSRKIKKPKMILAISAHWYTDGQFVRTAESNEQIYDMYGFPRELYKIKYEPKNDVDFAKRIISELDVKEDNSWGIDHGIWSILCKTYPSADIPVVMLSVDKNKSPREQYEFGKELKKLLNDDIVVVASGNIVHNLQLIDYNKQDGFNWANKFDNFIKENIINKNIEAIVNFNNNIFDYRHSVPTPEHFYPLLIALGCAQEYKQVEIFNEGCSLGSISMTSYIFES